MKELVSRLAIAAIMVAVATMSDSARAAPLVFQAVLENGGTPINDAIDLRFRLWDAATAGSQLGWDVLVEDRLLTDGYLTEGLDFGVSPSGDVGWLEIAVRDAASTGAYSILGPRRPLNPTPLAIRAGVASNAASATDALALDGQSGAYYLDWSNVTGVPTDLADGDDDVLGSVVCAEGEIAKPTGGTWGCAVDQGQVYSHTWVVGPVGSPTANGTALLAALAAIPTPTGADEAQLVKLEPGRYDLGTASLELEPWVSLEGSGRWTTVVASAVCDDGNTSAAVVEGADDTEIRGLAIENFCTDANSYAIGLLLNGDRIHVNDLSSSANPGAYQVSAVVGDGDGLELIDIEAHAQGGYFSSGIVLDGSALLSEVSVDVEATGRADGGIFVEASEVTIRDSVFQATGDTGTIVYALLLANNVVVERTSMISREPTIYATGLRLDLDLCSAPPCRMVLDGIVVESDAHAVEVINNYGYTTSISIDNSRIRGELEGIFLADISGSSYTVDVLRSTIHGGTNSVWVSSNPLSVRIALSQLSGGPPTGSTSGMVCAGVWDESFVFSASACP
jgi:hypothetical protein